MLDIQELSDIIKPYRAIMTQVEDAIVNERVSNYPVFVVSAEDFDIGLPVVDKAQLKIRASTLEELVAKSIVEMDKVDEFRTMYRAAHEGKFCLLFIKEGGSKIALVPR